MTTTKFKLNWLRKRQNKYIAKVSSAFYTVKHELIDFLSNYKEEPDIFIKYLSQCVQTDDVMTFISYLKGVIEESKNCKGDYLAKLARDLSNYILFRLYFLSKFTLQWTNITIKCKKCGRVHKHNFLYTNKLCPYCGNIIL